MFSDFVLGCTNKTIRQESMKLFLSLFSFSVDTPKIREAFIDFFLKKLAVYIEKPSQQEDSVDSITYSPKAARRSLILLIVNFLYNTKKKNYNLI